MYWLYVLLAVARRRWRAILATTLAGAGYLVVFYLTIKLLFSLLGWVFGVLL